MNFLLEENFLTMAIFLTQTLEQWNWDHQLHIFGLQGTQYSLVCTQEFVFIGVHLGIALEAGTSSR